MKLLVSVPTIAKSHPPLNITYLLFSLYQMILKFLFGGRQHISIWDLEGHKKPEGNLICLEDHLDADKKILTVSISTAKHKPDKEIGDLDCTEYREACKKAHCTSNQAKLRLHCYL